jgi:hypothetical protein
MHNNLLNNIAVDLVKDKVIEDKMKEYIESENAKNEQPKDGSDKDEDNDFEEIDSEEERIMQRELAKRKEQSEMFIERETKKKESNKYGDYRDIVETEFLDVLLKNPNVVCHFYHKDFERCKIIDKHLRLICNEHKETLFVRIDAEKTPFFTTKLNIRVIYFNIRFYQLSYLARMERRMIE